jgi:hypothetical protein
MPYAKRDLWETIGTLRALEMGRKLCLVWAVLTEWAKATVSVLGGEEGRNEMGWPVKTFSLRTCKPRFEKVVYGCVRE